MQCIALFAVAEGWLLLDIGWYVSFLWQKPPYHQKMKVKRQHTNATRSWKTDLEAVTSHFYIMFCSKKLRGWKIFKKKVFLCFAMYFALILQSHYPNRRSVSQKWENWAISADCRPTSVPIVADFMVGRRIFCRNTQVKSFVDRSADFQVFVIGEASGDGRLMIGRPSVDFLKIFSSWYRPKVARSLGVNRPTIARWSVDDILSKNRRKTDAGYRPSFSRWSPDCRSIINVGLYMCYIVYNACIHINYEIYHAFILFKDSFLLTSCTSKYLVFVLDFLLNTL